MENERVNLAHILGISEDEIKIDEMNKGLPFDATGTAKWEPIKYFLVRAKTKRKMNLPDFEELSQYPLIFENWIFDSLFLHPSDKFSGLVYGPLPNYAPPPPLQNYAPPALLPILPNHASPLDPSDKSSKLEISKVLGFRNCDIGNFSAKNVEFKSFFEMKDCQIGAQGDTNFMVIDQCTFEKVDFEKTKINVLILDFRGKTHFKNIANFRETHFTVKPASFLFRNVTFQKPVDFTRAQFEINTNKSESEQDIPKLKAFAKVDFEDEVHFTAAIFHQPCRFIDTSFGKDVHFNHAEFNKGVTFLKAKIGNSSDFYFRETKFREYSSFENIRFNNADFSRAKFEAVNFTGTKFEGNAVFYEVTFSKMPNFLKAVFKGELNLVNTKLNFDFEDLKKEVQKSYDDYKASSGGNEKSLENFANDFRDSFRNFKSIMIKDNNILDALNFHKMELYCKEIELKERWDKRRGFKGDEEGEELKNIIKENRRKLGDRIDSSLLRFYRKLSDHHTDFLKVFNNLILLIVLYIVFIYIGDFDVNYINKEVNNASNVLGKLSEYPQHFKEIIKNSDFMKKYGLSILPVLGIFLLCVLFSMRHLIIESIRTIKIIISRDKILKDFKHLSAVIAVLSLCMVLLNMYIPEAHNPFYVLANIGGFYLFIAFYLWLVHLGSLLLRYVFIFLSYITASLAIGVGVAILNPLNPLIEKLKQNGDNTQDPLFVVITLAYTILLALVLFSLQKTARRNSIVPN